MTEISKSIDFKPFSNKFATENDCYDYFYRLRWKNGFVCPRCKSKIFWEVKPYKYKCRNCGYQSTVTAGTILHGTHLNMLQWFKAVYYISIKRDLATATELQELADIGSNRTAQAVIKKLKPMLYCNSDKKLNWKDNPLEGYVEIKDYNIRHNGRTIVLIIAVEVIGKRIGRIRILESKMINSNTSTFDVLKRQYIKDGSVVSVKSRSQSSPYTNKVFKDFEEWHNGKDKNDIQKLCSYYCKMINRYKTPISFYTILKNIASCDEPPAIKSNLI